MGSATDLEATRAAIGKDKQLEIRNAKGKVLETFRALVLPHVSTLSRKTMERLAQWAAAGLVIVFVERLPEQSPEVGLDAPSPPVPVQHLRRNQTIRVLRSPC